MGKSEQKEKYMCEPKKTMETVRLILRLWRESDASVCKRFGHVQGKCVFWYQWATESADVPLTHETRKGHVDCLTKDEWEEHTGKGGHI